MSEMLARDKKHLNQVSTYHPDLANLEQPPATRDIPLGTYIDKGMSNVTVAITWDFALNGGMVGTKSLSGKLPAGAVITNVWTDELINVTSAGAPTIDLNIGATSVLTGVDPLLLSGVEAQTAALTKLTSESSVTMDVNVAAITAGRVRFLISYVMP